MNQSSVVYLHHIVLHSVLSSWYFDPSRLRRLCEMLSFKTKNCGAPGVVSWANGWFMLMRIWTRLCLCCIHSRLTKRRPKSATSHPSSRLEAKTCQPGKFADIAVTPTSCATSTAVDEPLNIDQSGDRTRGGSVPNEVPSIQQMVPDTEGDVELDVDSYYTNVDDTRRNCEFIVKSSQSFFGKFFRYKCEHRS